MNAEVLLKYFDRMSDAPDAIPRLRQFTLDLAVRGRLVEQDPNDEPANTLLARLINRGGPDNGQRRKSETQPAITSRDIPFALPGGWAWERLGNVGETNIGLTYSPQDVSDMGIPVLRSSNIQNGKLDFDDLVRVQTKPKPSAMVQDGDLLICARNGSRALVGKVALIENLKEPAAFGAFMAIFRSEMNKYLYHFICSPLFRLMIREVNTTTINQITQNNLRSTLAPIPPLAEQHRIVAKVEELMKLCDRLEEAQKEREARRDRLTAASLHELGNSAEGDDLGAPAEFFINHLSRLSARPDQIQLIRQTILDLAVRGRLLTQDPSDEPASVLLRRIELDRARLARSGEIKSQELLKAINGDDIEFQLPESWCWARLGTISRRIHYGFTASANALLTEVRFLRITDIQNNSVNWDSVPGCEISSDEAKQYGLTKGDILVARTGGTIGKTFLVADVPPKSVFASYLIRVQISTELFDRYIKLFLESPVYWKQLQEGARGTGQPNVNGQTLGRLMMAIPPLPEQHRIVGKVETLMTLCDRLEESLITTSGERRNLLDAVLHEVITTSTVDA
jgi:type I restriction enzyme, S subunit